MHRLPSLTYIVWGNEISSRLFKVGLDVFPEKVFHMWCIKCVIDLDGFCYSEPNRNECLFSSSFKQSFVNSFKRSLFISYFCLEYVDFWSLKLNQHFTFYWSLNALFMFNKIKIQLNDIKTIYNAFWNNLQLNYLKLQLNQ